MCSRVTGVSLYNIQCLLGEAFEIKQYWTLLKQTVTFFFCFFCYRVFFTALFVSVLLMYIYQCWYIFNTDFLKCLDVDFNLTLLLM